MINQISELINAGFSGIWIETSEPDEAIKKLEEIAKNRTLAMSKWNSTISDPHEAISVNKSKVNTIHIFCWLHLFLNSPIIIQELFSRVIYGKTCKSITVILAPHSIIPLELQKHFQIVEHPLPDKIELCKIASETIQEIPGDTDKWKDEAINASSGLTSYEAEGAFSLSLVRHGKLHKEEIWEVKQQMIKKSGVLTLYKNGENFSKLGGLEGIKSFCSKALSSPSARARGILCLGVPGAGKSAFAKALGAETGRPVLILEPASLMGSLVGETEANTKRALRCADAMSPCILFIDEIEKALSGGNQQYQGDSGVSSRLLGTLLTWLNDHTSDVFFIGTCNEIRNLPPAFTRAERFDGVFFFDLPSFEQKQLIWKIYKKEYNILANELPNDDNWTGAEIKSCCRLSILLDEPLFSSAKKVIPVAVTADTSIQELRQWANNRCLDAETGEIFKLEEVQPKLRRKVSK